MILLAGCRGEWSRSFILYQYWTLELEIFWCSIPIFNGVVLIKNSLLLSYHVPIFSTCTIRLASWCKLSPLMTRRTNKSYKLNDLRIHGEGCTGARLPMNSILSISKGLHEIVFKISGWCLHLEVGAQCYIKFWIGHLYTYVSFDFFICAELLPCLMVKVGFY